MNNLVKIILIILVLNFLFKKNNKVEKFGEEHCSKYLPMGMFFIKHKEKICQDSEMKKDFLRVNISSKLNLKCPDVSKFFSSTLGNTTFIIDNITYTIDDGNYNSSEILALINKIVPATIEFRVDTDTGKVIIQTTDTHNFNFQNDTDYPSLGETLGFTDLVFSIKLAKGEGYKTKESTYYTF